jgi:guanine nucleotide-binding protein G(I)/G(S)/G(T) subunit beta-1
MASVAELKEKHAAATASVNSLRERLRQRRQMLLDTDVERYSKAQGRTPVSFNQTDLVCCRTLQGHSGKVGWYILWIGLLKRTGSSVPHKMED